MWYKIGISLGDIMKLEKEINLDKVAGKNFGKENTLENFKEVQRLFKELLLSEPPYKVVEFTISQILGLGMSDLTIPQYCSNCKQERDFKSKGTFDAKDYLQEVINLLVREDKEVYEKGVAWACNIVVKCEHCGEQHIIPILIKDSKIQRLG